MARTTAPMAGTTRERAPARRPEAAGRQSERATARQSERASARHGTRQGEAIAEVLRDVAEFRTAQDIHAELRRRGHKVGLTTVYRHLTLLAERGAVDTLRTPAGEVAYRRCAAHAHHHHLVCRSCGKTLEFEGREVERWAERVARLARFHDVSHTVEIFGTCEECAAAR